MIAGLCVVTSGSSGMFAACIEHLLARGGRNPHDMTTQAAKDRWVAVHEAADAVGSLISDAASAITGIHLSVDAGWQARSTWMTYGGVPAAGHAT